MDFHRRLGGRGSFKEEVNCQMQLRRQRGRELRKTPDLAKKIIIIWRQQNGEEQRRTEVKRQCCSQQRPRRAFRSTFKPPVVCVL